MEQMRLHPPVSSLVLLSRQTTSRLPGQAHDVTKLARQPGHILPPPRHRRVQGGGPSWGRTGMGRTHTVRRLLRRGCWRTFAEQRGRPGAAPQGLRTRMLLLLLLALSLGLASAQETLEEVPVQPGFDAQKVEGRWLTMQLATSHKDLVLPTDPLRLALHSIQTREGGDMELVLFWMCECQAAPSPGSREPWRGLPGWGSPSPQRQANWEPQEGDLFPRGEGVCRGMNVTIHPAGRPGQYQGSSVGGSMHICFVSTDYSNLILYVRLEDVEVTSLWALLARTMLEDPMWLGRYLEYVEKFHLQKVLVFNVAVSMSGIPMSRRGLDWLHTQLGHP
ncbi:beta-lactoglobulin isoform X1 [Sciurus carolinensis]|uniref:beta-lactoglobulin isoform X1 n=1 Tax=Sciurus carolinensis TaxID=30640 RepID=UPI001FB1AEB5|nr:beta-lactoglobulin isoform X1 [Sciurus carolinensis]